MWTGFSYAWDREGRLTARTNTQAGETTRFSWSDDGRLRTVTLPSGGTVRYAYDPLGRRIATTNAGGVRRVQTYGLDPNAVAEQTGSDPRTRYTFGLGYDTPLAMTTRSSSAVFFQQDALSSVTSLTNAAGAVTGRATYDTYGQITTQTGQTSPYTYTGREHEPATGLYQYRARWYDPATGRFVSEDPVPGANLYAYANGQPLAANDPTGRFAITTAETNAGIATEQALIGMNVAVWKIVSCGGTRNIWQLAGRAALGGLGGLVAGTPTALLARLAWAKLAGRVGERAAAETAEEGGGLIAAILASAAPILPGAILDGVIADADAPNWDSDPAGWFLSVVFGGASSGASGTAGVVGALGTAVISNVGAGLLNSNRCNGIG